MLAPTAVALAEQQVALIDSVNGSVVRTLPPASCAKVGKKSMIENMALDDRGGIRSGHRMMANVRIEPSLTSPSAPR